MVFFRYVKIKIKANTYANMGTLSNQELFFATDNNVQGGLYIGTPTGAAKITMGQLDLDGKVDKISGMGLSTEDFTISEKDALDAASDTPSASIIPIADSNGQLVGWIPDGTTSIKGKVQLDSTPGTGEITAQTPFGVSKADKLYFQKLQTRFTGAGWEWVNQGSASNNGAYIYAPSTNEGVHYFGKAIPSSNFTATFQIIPQMIPGASTSLFFGVCIYNKINGNYDVYKFQLSTSNISFELGATLFYDGGFYDYTFNQPLPAIPFWIKIYYKRNTSDSTQSIFYSVDGQNWTQLFTKTDNNVIADSYGVCLQNPTASGSLIQGFIIASLEEA